jgi:hypothetical protein
VLRAPRSTRHTHSRSRLGILASKRPEFEPDEVGVEAALVKSTSAMQTGPKAGMPTPLKNKSWSAMCMNMAPPSNPNASQTIGLLYRKIFRKKLGRILKKVGFRLQPPPCITRNRSRASGPSVDAPIWRLLRIRTQHKQLCCSTAIFKKWNFFKIAVVGTPVSPPVRDRYVASLRIRTQHKLLCCLPQIF